MFNVKKGKYFNYIKDILHLETRYNYFLKKKIKKIETKIKHFIGSTLFMLTIKFLQICIWFGIGVIIYNHKLKGPLGLKLKNKINTLTFIELTAIFFTLIYFIHFLLAFFFNYYFNF